MKIKNYNSNFNCGNENDAKVIDRLLLMKEKVNTRIADCPCKYPYYNFEHNLKTMSLDFTRKAIVAIGEEVIAVHIDYCPFCGRPLYEK